MASASALDGIMTDGGIENDDMFVRASAWARSGSATLEDSAAGSAQSITKVSTYRLCRDLHALRAGAPVEETAEVLDWRSFEGLVAAMLQGRDYRVSRNVTFCSPRMEIDVIGVKGDISVLVDCKHWRRNVPLADVASRQVARARRYAQQNPRTRAIPVIVTLYRQAAASAHIVSAERVSKVPVVPVEQFGAFLDGIHGHLDEVTVVVAS